MGYKGEVIKRYFWDLQNLSGSLNFELATARSGATTPTTTSGKCT
jgi:hypothetical protein